MLTAMTLQTERVVRLFLGTADARLAQSASRNAASALQDRWLVERDMLQTLNDLEAVDAGESGLQQHRAG